MNFVIDNDVVMIELSNSEKILSFHSSFEIPISQISEITDVLLPTTWKEIRAPGTSFPGVKAGTYYTSRGKEFWMLRRKDNPIRIELNNNRFKRLVLGVKDHDRWIFTMRVLKEKVYGNR
jgi:hypothetical protein